MSLVPRAKTGPVLRREDLLTVAVRHFADGYAATSVHGIAREIGVSQSAVQHHAPTKDALFGATIDEVIVPRLAHARGLATSHRMTLNKERKGIEASDSATFLDPEEDFRWEVLTSWARRIPAGEKHSLPLPEFRLGPEFLVSLDEIHGISRRKVADVVVEVLTGRAESNPSRELHPLRSGTGGDDLPVRRDGASCWRVSLQTNTPSARRLHFWRSADHIELSRVVLHDDFRPWVDYC